MNHKLSQLRAKLQRTQDDIQQLLEEFQGRQPMLPASLYTLRRRCGKANCRCAEGHLHATTVLSYRGGQKPQTITPPTNQIEKLKKITDEYRRVRKARTTLVRLQGQLLSIVDQIQDLRVAEGERALAKVRSTASHSTRR
ncbi:MAG: hypothetical protein KY475_22070 [Planctomycetes bacterium]|nr:hypothetical protein [Planctomycetota bacterium]